MRTVLKIIIAVLTDKSFAELIAKLLTLWHEIQAAEASGEVEVSRSLQPDLHKALQNAVITYRVEQRVRR